MCIERLARIALLKGLLLLAGVAEESEAVGPAIAKRRSNRLSEGDEAYIREHWQQETDEQMGVALGYGRYRVMNVRRELGLRRPKGRRRRDTSASPAATTAPSQALSRTEKRNGKFAKLDALIREHWKTTGDWEIGRMLEPAVSGNSVQQRRYKLELKGVRGIRRFNNSLKPPP